MKYNITPVAKPRMTRRDGAKSKQNRIQGMRPVVAKYFAFKDQIRLHKLFVPASGSHIIFHMPMPASWSKNKKSKMDGMPHQPLGGPDKDNLEKALLDAIFDNDSHIWDSRVTKLWAIEPGIEIKQYESMPKK